MPKISITDMQVEPGNRKAGCSGLRATIVACVLVLLLFSFPAFAQARHSSARLRTLRTISDVFRLSKAEPRKAYPIELDAVVTYSDPEWGTLFVQDSTGTTFIDVHGENIVYPPGTRVRVRAVSYVNENGTRIGHPAITVLGRGLLPKPELRSVAELDAGAGEAHRVVTEGALHPCEHDWHRACFRLYDGKKLVWLLVRQPDGPAAQSLFGAVVRVTGLAARHEDEDNKRIGTELFVNNFEEIKIERPPLPFSFSSPPVPIGDLRASEADERFTNHVHVRGTVTWQSPGLLCIHDGSGMVFVGSGKDDAVRTGSTVDAIGFPSHGVFGLELSDATVRLAGVQPSSNGIAPLRLTAAETVRRALNGSKVRIRARLMDQNANATEFVYQLEDGEQRFNAILLRNDATQAIVGLSRNSVVELTGVALIRNGTADWPSALLILVESPQDIVVVRANDWLTFKQRVAVASGTAFCAIAAFVWVALLRRTVRKQTGIIRARLESELQLETKYRRLFERNLAAVFSWQADGTIVDCNLAFARMLGFESGEKLIGRSYWDFELDPTRRERLLKAPPGEVLSNREGSLRRDDGVTVHLLRNITPVQTAEGLLYETTAIDVTQLRENQAELQKAKDTAVYESLNDPLTGLPNRRLLLNTLSFLLDKARREGGTIALLYLDLDGFKLVNDSLGHPIGDALLVQVAACLRSWIRKGDLLGRLGGDEFMVILDGLHAKEDAAMVAENLLDAISNPLLVEGHELNIGASIGISTFPDDASNAEELMKQADSAMYAAKREGKNRVGHFTPEIGSLVHERLSLENLLRGAVARGEILVHYQPEFDLASHRLIRFEALARWTHPTLGSISPIKFISIAEESGIINSLGAFILEQACIEAVRWQSIMPYPIQVAVNVSNIQFRRKGFVEEICMILDRTRLNPKLLQIELTESVMLSGASSSTDTMNRLHELGITLAIDDFGTGYSNLSYLPSLPFDALKIDRSFVTNMETQPESESMIRTLIVLAKNMGMRVIVEGVETPAQLELIRALGANEVQGYLMGRPTADPIGTILLAASVQTGDSV
jgi:diguanylate cyclase (GGDEF)-like protein/PAS domain S-box-containing protein